MTGSVAGKSLSGSSMAYSVTKAAQVHLMKCLANTQGPKVRINSVLPGLLLTDWGNLYGEERLAALKGAAALKKETELGDCAQAYVDIARNTSMTGQAVHVGKWMVFVFRLVGADSLDRFWFDRRAYVKFRSVCDFVILHIHSIEQSYVQETMTHCCVRHVSYPQV